MSRRKGVKSGGFRGRDDDGTYRLPKKHTKEESVHTWDQRIVHLYMSRRKGVKFLRSSSRDRWWGHIPPAKNHTKDESVHTWAWPRRRAHKKWERVGVRTSWESPHKRQARPKCEIKIVSFISGVPESCEYYICRWTGVKLWCVGKLTFCHSRKLKSLSDSATYMHSKKGKLAHSLRSANSKTSTYVCQIKVEKTFLFLTF